MRKSRYSHFYRKVRKDKINTNENRIDRIIIDTNLTIVDCHSTQVINLLTVTYFDRNALKVSISDSEITSYITLNTNSKS